MKIIIGYLIGLFFVWTTLGAVEVASIPSNAMGDINTSMPGVSEKRIFGDNLFNGSFSQNRQLRFDPNYLVNVGDSVNVNMWGAFEYSSALTVDKQGNIFIPKVGAVNLLGSRSDQLSEKVRIAVRRVYNNNVFVYADLQNYQAVSVFVTGLVAKPGLYEGLSSDSVVQFLDKAGGIQNNGSYRRIDILRNNELYKTIDLYRFLVDGKMEVFQFKMGDVVVVKSLMHTIDVRGDVKRPYRFEFPMDAIPFKTLSQLTGPNPSATNIVISSWGNNNTMSSKLLTMKEAQEITLEDGNTVEFIPDHTAQTVSVTVSGEHQNLHTLVLPKGSTLKDLLNQISYSSLSDKNGIQLFRQSVAERQKELLNAQLDDLEHTALTTGSETSEEATIRRQEAQSILDFVNRARQVQPKGQVVINPNSDLGLIALEDNDTVYVPGINRTVIVQGEVMLPGAQTYAKGLKLDDYVSSSGGYNFRANKNNILVVRTNGKVLTYDSHDFFSTAPEIEPGDSILVLGKVDSKDLQIVKDITQIIYQTAVGAAVVIKSF